MSRPFTSAWVPKSASEPHASLHFPLLRLRCWHNSLFRRRDGMNEQHRKHKKPLQVLNICRSVCVCVWWCCLFVFVLFFKHFFKWGVFLPYPFNASLLRHKSSFLFRSSISWVKDVECMCPSPIFCGLGFVLFLSPCPCFLYIAFLKGSHKYCHSLALMESAWLLGYGCQAHRIAGGVLRDCGKIFPCPFFFF